MSDLAWEIAYLEKNLNPTDSSGRVLSLISAQSSNLKDSNVQALAGALKKNSVFKGGIRLDENHLTDLGILYLTRALQASGASIDYLNLSFNNLKDRSGVYIGELLTQGYKLKELHLRGCCVESLGVQRIFETLSISSLQILDIGIVHSPGMHIMAKYLPRAKELKELIFQQGDPWDNMAMRAFISGMKENMSILSLQIINCENEEFIDEVQGITDRNRGFFEQGEVEKQQAQSLDPKVFAEEIQGYIENSIQNLPVRVYLTNSLGTLLNDGVFQLMKFRFNEQNPSKNTAVNNIKWLIRFILDKAKNS